MINCSDDLIDGVINKIVDKRIDLGYTMEYMAISLEISTAAYHKIEKKETRLNLERLFRIQQVLELSFEDLFSFSKSKEFIDDHTKNNINKWSIRSEPYDADELGNALMQSLRAEVNLLRQRINLLSQ